MKALRWALALGFLAVAAWFMAIKGSEDNSAAVQTGARN
jgi:uncharacterized membrane protein YhdT